MHVAGQAPISTVGCFSQNFADVPERSAQEVTLGRAPRGRICRALPPVKLQPERSAPSRGAAGSERVSVASLCSVAFGQFVGFWRKILLTLLVASKVTLRLFSRGQLCWVVVEICFGNISQNTTDSSCVLEGHPGTLLVSSKVPGPALLGSC